MVIPPKRVRRFLPFCMIVLLFSLNVCCSQCSDEVYPPSLDVDSVDGATQPELALGSGKELEFITYDTAYCVKKKLPFAMEFGTLGDHRVVVLHDNGIWSADTLIMVEAWVDGGAYERAAQRLECHSVEFLYITDGNCLELRK